MSLARLVIPIVLLPGLLVLIDRPSRRKLLLLLLAVSALLAIAALLLHPALVAARKDGALRILGVQAHLITIGEDVRLALVQLHPHAALHIVALAHERWRLATADKRGRAVGEHADHGLNSRHVRALLLHIPPTEHLILAIAHNVWQRPVFGQRRKAVLRHRSDAIQCIKPPLDRLAVALLLAAVALLLLTKALLLAAVSILHLKRAAARRHGRPRVQCRIKRNANDDLWDGREEEPNSAKGRV